MLNCKLFDLFFFFLISELYKIIKPEIKEIPVKSFNTQNNKKKEVINFTYLVDELLFFFKKKSWKG